MDTAITTTVWLIENEDYPDSGGGFERAAYATLSDAVDSLHTCYGAPYIVTWVPVDATDNEGPRLIGHFQQVPGYSIRHTASWMFHEVPLTSGG